MPERGDATKPAEGAEDAPRKRRTRLPGALGETAAIAGVAAVSYLVALAYRAGQMYGYGFPVTVAAVRLSDAAFAGLYVLLGGFAVILVIDILESRRQGTMDKIGKVAVFVALLVLLLSVIVPAATIGFLLAGALGLLVGVVLSGILSVGAGLLFWRLAGWIMAVDVKVDSLQAAANKYPGPTLFGVLAVALCLISAAFGLSGLGIPGSHYLVADSGEQVAVALFDDRVVLAGIDVVQGDTARLDGTLKIIALPSNEVTFTSSSISRVVR